MNFAIQSCTAAKKESATDIQQGYFRTAILHSPGKPVYDKTVSEMCDPTSLITPCIFQYFKISQYYYNGFEERVSLEERVFPF